MIDIATQPQPKPRTGLAILTAFLADAVFSVAYGAFFSVLIWLGARYDHSGMWMLPALIFVFLPSALAGYGALLVTFKIFKTANREAVFYAFATGTIVMLIAVIAADHEAVVRDTIQAVLGIVGARIAVAMNPVAN